MRRLRFGDKLLRVRDEPEPPSKEDPRRPPLLCIHGAGMSSVVFMDLVRRFAPGRRVIAPDLPGHGQSDRWHDPISIDGYRDAVGTVAATLKLSRAVLIGHSMGAAVALACALAWPERVAGLVLLNGAARLDVPDEVLNLLTRSLPAFPKGDNERVDRMPSDFASLSFSPATSADVRARWQAVLFSATRGVILADFMTCRSFDVRAALAALTASQARIPTLILSGRDDLLVPPSLAAETFSLMQGVGQEVCHEIIADAGHLLHLERPEACYAHLERFINR